MSADGGSFSVEILLSDDARLVKLTVKVTQNGLIHGAKWLELAADPPASVSDVLELFASTCPGF